MQYSFDFAPRPLMRLQVIEEILRKQNILAPVPTRNTLIAWLEEGRLEGRQVNGIWHIYRDSFEGFVRELAMPVAA